MSIEDILTWAIIAIAFVLFALADLGGNRRL